MQKKNRRDFIKMMGISGIGIGWTGKAPFSPENNSGIIQKIRSIIPNGRADISFIPNRVASWWCTLEDLQWPQKKITDKIKRRAEGFAAAKIDTAINFGFHVRFDFSNYFGQLHAYFANVCNELHQYDIKFLDHYSCNNVERPRGETEIKKLNKIHRHHTLLYHDPAAAKYAQYEGYYFNDLCQVDLRDGGRGYTPIYQFETFCHNNPAFLDMHRKYLERLMKEVPMDGIQVDDMCDYAGLYVCGCRYCRDRFKKEYGHTLPPLSDVSFWGTIKNEFDGGNYDNPAFKDWIKMRADSVADHVKLVKSIIGKKPLMTCCSSSGPIRLNALTLNLETMAPHLDLFMLENVGINVNSVNWTRMDAEALHQKDIAQKRGNAPAMAVSYTIYEKGGYLGWALSRFWGVSNWSSTLNGRLEEDPADAMETHDIIASYNKWEIKHSNLDYRSGEDLTEARLVSNSYCRDNGWRDEEGKEHWDRVLAWSSHLLKSNIGYRFVRADELADSSLLLKENSPLILDGVGCVSDKQFSAVKTFLSKGGKAWMALPFGTHNEKGIKRPAPLSEKIIKAYPKNIIVTASAIKINTVTHLIEKGKLTPVVIQTAGDKRWAVRIRKQSDKIVIQFMNIAIKAIPHPALKDASGTPILKDIDTLISDNNLRYEIDLRKVALSSLELLSPEINEEKKPVSIVKISSDSAIININLEGIKTYAIAQ